MNKNLIYLILCFILVLFLVNSCKKEIVSRKLEQQCYGYCEYVYNDGTKVKGVCGGNTCGDCIFPVKNLQGGTIVNLCEAS